MPLLIGGAVAAVFGLISLVFWWGDFMILVRGALPICLLLGGVLAIYVGIDDMQDKAREERRRQERKLDEAREEIENVRAKAELYKEELERLREVSKLPENQNKS